jgi:hypothetical protein
MGDKEAIQQINRLVVQAATKPEGDDLLKTIRSAAPAPVGAITRPILERSAASQDEALAITAIHALEGDAPSAPARFAIVKDANKPVAIRQAALDGLIHHPDTEAVALALMKDATQTPILRAQAADVLRAHIRGRGDARTRPVPEPVLTALRDIAADPSNPELQNAAANNLKILVPGKP